ncbi:MAG TPA: CoA pyrophosphatase [Vicinamibacterales bacterium]|nr:CoA pyrophosphatase [Vicinamibacterales bacterium]
MIFSDAIDVLQRRLRETLPGPDAHAHLAPIPRRQWPASFNPARIRNAAGLLLLFPVDDRPRVVLTERAHTLERHRGQISLPGGVVDPGETFERAALREANEEIGLATDAVRVLGALTPIDIPVSGFRLHPIVAMTHDRPALTPHDGEVARIVEVALDELLHPSTLAWTRRERDGVAIAVPTFRVNGVDIWGATAMVLAEFLALFGWAPISAKSARNE